MRVHICVVGRLRAGPEFDLVNDYLTRFDRSGRSLGLGPAKIIEIDNRKGGGKSAEGAQLSKAVPTGSVICALDERGQHMTSPEFAISLSNWRDQGRGDLAFMIGGADGIDPSLVKRADRTLSFGAMVWPHMLARVMLAEQLYRAANILAGTPYHRS